MNLMHAQGYGKINAHLILFIRLFNILLWNIHTNGQFKIGKRRKPSLLLYFDLTLDIAI